VWIHTVTADRAVPTAHRPAHGNTTDDPT